MEKELPDKYGGHGIELVKRKCLNRHIAPRILTEAELQDAER